MRTKRGRGVAIVVVVVQRRRALWPEAKGVVPHRIAVEDTAFRTAFAPTIVHWHSSQARRRVAPLAGPSFFLAPICIALEDAALRTASSHRTNRVGIRPRYDGEWLVRPDLVYARSSSVGGGATWDADSIFGCVCEEGWSGYDCSERQARGTWDEFQRAVYVCLPLRSTPAAEPYIATVFVAFRPGVRARRRPADDETDHTPPRFVRCTLFVQACARGDDPLTMGQLDEVQVRAKEENTPHSKRSAALSCRPLGLGFRHVMELGLVRATSRGERHTRRNDG